MTRGQKAAETRRRNREAKARMEAAQAETRRVVSTGQCPSCGSTLRRNLALSGWWQCQQLGAETHRARPQDPPCDWQGFTS